MNAVLREQPRYGIFPDEPASDYYVRRLDEASASGLKQLLRSPAHFKHWVENPDADKSSPALDFGRAFHMAVLEPERFASAYALPPANAPRYPTDAQWNAKGKRSPESQAAVDFWRDWNAENKGRERLSASDYDRIQGMAASVMAHPVARGLVQGGDRETTFRWVDEETGIACKSRADLYASGEFLMDLKSCRDASPDGFARAVATYGYATQQAHYVDGIRSNGDAIRWFVFLAVETEAPYVCQPHLLDARAEQHGFDQRQRAMRRLQNCLQTNHWPGYSDRLNELALPAYAFYNEDTEQ